MSFGHRDAPDSTAIMSLEEIINEVNSKHFFQMIFAMQLVDPFGLVRPFCDDTSEFESGSSQARVHQ